MAAHTADWQAENQRITLFLEPGAKVPVADEVWGKLTGLPPEEVTSKPARGLQQASGTFANATFLVQINSARVDFFLAPLKTEEPTDSPPNVGPYKDSAKVLADSLVKWIDDAPPVIRLAYGVSALASVESRHMGYLLLKTLLPAVDIDADNSSDFLYQINRPRTSPILPGLTINRLNKWSCARIVFATGTMGANREFKFVGTTSSELNFCKAELDLNTDADRETALPREKIGQLFIELFALADEILIHGDRP